MTAIILAGGKGTRLKPLTVTVPKPLLPLGEVPIIEVVIAQLVSAGVTRILISVGHMADLLVAILGDGRRWGVELGYLRETEPQGTAGAIRLAGNLPDESFLIINGDVLTTLDFKALLAWHSQQQAHATIAAHQRFVDIDYGVLNIGAEDRLAGYDEKPRLSYWVSMGINALHPRALRYLPAEGRFDMPQLMQAMAEAGERVMCFRTDCYWQDIGRLDDYNQASADFVAAPHRFLPGHPRA